MSVGVGCVYFTTCINIIKIREIYILNKIIASIYFKLNKLNHWCSLCSLFVSIKDSNINRTLAGTQTHTQEEGKSYIIKFYNNTLEFHFGINKIEKIGKIVIYRRKI